MIDYLKLLGAYDSAKMFRAHRKLQSQVSALLYVISIHLLIMITIGPIASMDGSR